MSGPGILTQTGAMTSVEMVSGVLVGVIIVVVYYLILRYYVAREGNGRLR